MSSDTPSSAAGLQAGDVIVAVNGKDVSSCRHKEAQDVIVRAGNNFKLTVNRGGLMQQAWQPQIAASAQTSSQPTASYKNRNAGNWDNTLNANKPGAATNAEDFTKSFMADMYGGSNNNSAPTNRTNTPQQHLKPSAPSPSFRTASPSSQSGGFTTVASGPKMASYNSPAGLYSDSNIKDAIEQQSETLASGVKG